MATLGSRIARALERAKEVSRSKRADILHSDDISQADRKLLVANGWLKEIMRGWYLLLRPDVADGDSTAWYAHFWEFLRVYLHHYYDGNYCLSADSSLVLHVRSTTIPSQVIAITLDRGVSQDLPYETSIFAYPDAKNFPQRIVELQGLQCMSLPLALCKVSPLFYQKSPIDAEIALGLLPSVDEILDIAVNQGLLRGVGRVIGGLEHIGRKKEATQLREQLKQLGLEVREENPFIAPPLKIIERRQTSPYVRRIQVMWEAYRKKIVPLFESLPKKPLDPKDYLQLVQQSYESDAYNSLSIEGYHVDAALIHRVENHGWDPENIPQDAVERDALAARGYFEAFQQIKQSLQAILESTPAGECIEQDLPKWYSKLVDPMVRANIINVAQASGYRLGPVYIRGSTHVPPPREALLDAMDTFFECLKNEPHPGVRAVLGHYVFVFIHPYPDGNGRMARFLMNACLASGGYPWTVVRVKRRAEYIGSLQHVQAHNEIEAFARFVVEELEESAKNWG